jgi:hypothetical protein
MAKDRLASEQGRVERAEEYMTAAREHYAALGDLPDIPSHLPLAYYLAGLAVECLFRAYSELVGAAHDSGHDLRRLAASARFFSFMPDSQRDDLSDDLNEVYKRWLNNHRYRSKSSLQRFLNDAELYRLPDKRTIKGDVTRYNWIVLYESSSNLLTWGIEQWKSSKDRFSK